MNSFGVFDAQQLRWKCDAYYLDLEAKGPHHFKIADPSWTANLTFGPDRTAPAQPQGDAIAAKPGASDNFTFDFQGAHHLKLSRRDDRTVLEVGTGRLAADADKPTDPVALSLSHDSRALADKRPFGAIAAGRTITFGLNALPGVDAVTLVIERRELEGNQEKLAYHPVARIPMQRSRSGGRERWSASYRFDTPQVYGYHFEATIGERTYIYQNNASPIYWTRELGANGRGSVAKAGDGQGLRRFRQTVFAPDYRVPAWAQDAVYYYIYPERFRNGDRSNDPKPGVTAYHDRGVELHANWLDQPWRPGSGDGSDDLPNNDFFGGDLQGVIDKLDYIAGLGANTIYMTPVFKAASNHKYDTADYRQIDPHFGSNADYTRLTIEAKKRGIRVIADASFNHTGSDSLYFDRYAKFPGKGAFEGGRIQPDSPYAGWYAFDHGAAEPSRQYTGWGGTPDLPELNKASRTYRAFAYEADDSITRLWLRIGAAGWRMDVAPWVPDDFWRAWRKTVKAERADALTIAETWFDSSKYFLGDTFDSTMNYIFRNAVLDYAGGAKATDIYRNIELMREAYPPQAFYALMNLLSTHDQARSLHVLGDHGPGGDPAAAALARRRFGLAVFFQMMFPGAPAVYYGDEVGVTGGDDPANRATYPWADQGGKPDATLAAQFKRLIAMRKQHAVLRRGSIDAPLHIDDNVIVLARRDGATWAICAVNNADVPRSMRVRLPAGAAGARYADALDGRAAKVEGGYLTLEIPALYGTVLVGSAK